VVWGAGRVVGDSLYRVESLSATVDRAEARSYRGYGPDRLGAGLVVVEVAGTVEGPLRHCAWHSPTGMSWGYCGAGPADLARSLLIDALGADARCTVCEGTARVVYDIVDDREIPSRDANHDVMVCVAGERQKRYSEPMRCLGCEGGYAVPPSLYQLFKREVVSNLDQAGWTLSCIEILRWIDGHR
jgi:hypothetical protein